MSCVICNGPLNLLGHLGWFTWYRCENCGFDQHAEEDKHPENFYEEIEEE